MDVDFGTTGRDVADFGRFGGPFSAGGQYYPEHHGGYPKNIYLVGLNA